MQTKRWMLICLATVLLAGTAGAGGQSDWRTSRAAALAAAQTEGKLILLLAGRNTCGNTMFMKSNMTERASIQQVLNHNYVPWYCNIDQSDEWRTYAGGLGAFTLPLICVINPADVLHYLSRKTGVQADEAAFRAWLVSFVPGADAYEPDNTRSTAKSIARGRTQNRSLHMSGDVDWAKFTVGSAGATGVVVKTGGPAGGNTEIWLYRSGSATPVGYDDDSGPGAYSRIALPALAAGTYYIQVQEFLNDDKIPAYTLYAGWGLPPPLPDAYEPDNTSARAKRIANNQTQPRTIHAAGNADWAKFRIGSRGAVNVEIKTAGASGDTQLWLYRANAAGTGAGTRLAFDDDSGPGRFSKITRATLGPGTYYIKVQEKGNNGTIPAYTLKARWTPQ